MAGRFFKGLVGSVKGWWVSQEDGEFHKKLLGFARGL